MCMVKGLTSLLTFVRSKPFIFLHTQSQLRQREGEVGQLRREVARLNEKHERLLAELSEQSAKAESRLSLLSLEVDVEGKSLSQRYEVLLQLYGQKLEENNELKLDLREAKEAYQSQVSFISIAVDCFIVAYR